MIDQIQRLFEHLEWADDRVLQRLRKIGGHSEDILQLYGHILGAEHVWLARLEGRPPTVAVWPDMPLKEYESVAGANHTAYRSFVAALDESTLGRTVRYTNSAGLDFTSRVDDVLIHVALHGCYHRGQIATLLREAGEAPEPTDYIAFVRGAPAATRESSISQGG